MLRQRVHGLALGYEDLNDQDAIRDDPVVQTACGRDAALTNSSTLCWFEQGADRQWAIAIHEELWVYPDQAVFRLLEHRLTAG